MSMPLSAGTRLGCYEILSQIGAGGMAEVYRARDARLGPIGGGSDEIMREILGRILGL